MLLYCCNSLVNSTFIIMFRILHTYSNMLLLFIFVILLNFPYFVIKVILALKNDVAVIPVLRKKINSPNFENIRRKKKNIKSFEPKTFIFFSISIGFFNYSLINFLYQHFCLINYFIIISNKWPFMCL